jgi:DNA adenine methylase
MKYMGSKSRLVKDIVPLMLAYRQPDDVWVEPFVGGANVFSQVANPRLGSDANPYTIQALISIRDYVNELPKNNLEFTEEDYRKLRHSDAYPHKGFASFTYSYGAKFLGGWARNKSNRDYVTEAYNSAVKQSPLLQGSDLICCDYKDLVIPSNAIVYCDPPYKNTTQYSKIAKFNHDEFWDWCRNLPCKVFVSEYEAPDDFTCIYEREIDTWVNKKEGKYKKASEKLFTYA